MADTTLGTRIASPKPATIMQPKIGLRTTENALPQVVVLIGQEFDRHQIRQCVGKSLGSELVADPSPFSFAEHQAAAAKARPDGSRDSVGWCRSRPKGPWGTRARQGAGVGPAVEWDLPVPSRTVRDWPVLQIASFVLI